MAKDKGDKSGGSSRGGSGSKEKDQPSGGSRGGASSRGGAGAGRGQSPGANPGASRPSGGGTSGAGAGRGGDPRNFGGGGDGGDRNNYGNVSITGTKGGPGGGGDSGAQQQITNAVADSGMVDGFVEGPLGTTATSRESAMVQQLAANPNVQGGIKDMLGLPAGPAAQPQTGELFRDVGKRQFEQMRLGMGTLPQNFTIPAGPDSTLVPGFDPQFDPRFAGVGYGPNPTTAQIAEAYQYGGPSVGVYGNPNNPSFNAGPNVPAQVSPQTFTGLPGDMPTGFGGSLPTLDAPSMPGVDARISDTVRMSGVNEFSGLPDYMTQPGTAPAQSRVNVPSMGTSPGYVGASDPSISKSVPAGPSVPTRDAAYSTVDPTQSRVNLPSLDTSPSVAPVFDPGVIRNVGDLFDQVMTTGPSPDMSPAPAPAPPAPPGMVDFAAKTDTPIAPGGSQVGISPGYGSFPDMINVDGRVSYMSDQVLPPAPPGGVVGDIEQSVFDAASDIAPRPPAVGGAPAPVPVPTTIPTGGLTVPTGPRTDTATGISAIAPAAIAADTSATAAGIPPGSFAPMGGGLLAGAVNLVNPLGRLTGGPGFLPPSDPFTMDDFIAQQTEMDRGPENRVDPAPPLDFDPAPAEDPSVQPSEKPAWWPPYLPWPPEPGTPAANMAPPSAPVQPFTRYSTSYGPMQSAISGAGNPLMMGIGGMVRRP